jgi:hypothetical protein
MLSVPRVLAGAIAVTSVAETTVTAVPSAVPKCTAVAPVRFVPWIVIFVPPAVGPLDGETPVTVGAAV